jgi:hypothetical protein
MIYNLSKEDERQTGIARMKELLDNKSIIELSEARPIRSLSSNAYLHVLFCLFGNHFGHSLKYTKNEIKKLCPFVANDVETSKMTDVEFSVFVEWFLNYSALDGGFALCTPEEYKEHKKYYDKEINRYKAFM